MSDEGDDGAAALNGQGGQQNQQGDWRAPFSIGLQQEEAKAWNEFSSRHKDPQSFAKNVLELRKSHDSRIPVPGPDAKDEEWHKVFDRLGRPKEPTAYEFRHLQDAPPLDDSEKEAREGLRSVAHRLGITQKQLDGLTQWNDSFRKTSVEAYKVSAKSQAEKAVKALKSEWGPDHDKNLNTYRTTLQEYAGDDFKEFASMRLSDGSFLGDNPKFVKLIHKFAAERGEDDRDFGNVDPSAKEGALVEIEKIEREALAKGLNPTSQNWPNHLLQPLYAKAHGTKPMGPGGTRIRK